MTHDQGVNVTGNAAARARETSIDGGERVTNSSPHRPTSARRPDPLQEASGSPGGTPQPPSPTCGLCGRPIRRPTGNVNAHRACLQANDSTFHSPGEHQPRSFRDGLDDWASRLD